MGYRRPVRRRIDPIVLLLLTPLLWGATFPGTKIALRHLPAFAFMAWSRTLGFVTILVLWPVLRRAEDDTGARAGTGRPRRAAVGAGARLGAASPGGSVPPR